MAGPAEEELAALAAIFCGPREWEVLSRSETDGTVFRILTEAEGLTEDVAVPLELVFHLPASYPSCVPGISVSSEHLTRAQRTAVREKLLERARSLPAEPMVHQLVLWVQQHLGRILTQTGLGPGPGPGPCSSSATGRGEEGLWMALLRLDHMRARTRYVKAVQQWTSDLGLTGRLVFLGKAILLLLQGCREDIKVGGANNHDSGIYLKEIELAQAVLLKIRGITTKLLQEGGSPHKAPLAPGLADVYWLPQEYLVLQKTCRVDVDASGKKCREKMLSVLFEGPAQPQHARFPSFEVREYRGVDELRREFEATGLQGLLSEFVLGLAK